MSKHVENTGPFRTGTEADWRAMVEKVLRGADYEQTLVTLSDDGIARGPLFTKDDSGDQTRVSRFAGPAMENRPWCIGTLIAHPAIAQANADARLDLKGGAGALVIRTDPVGRNGLLLQSLSDMQRLFADLCVDPAPVVFFPSPGNFETSALFAVDSENHGTIRQSPQFLNYVPIALDNSEQKKLGGLLQWAVEHTDNWRALCVDARRVHEAGGTPVQELAFMLAHGAACIRRCMDAGLAINTILPRFSVCLAADQDGHQTLTKFRAARLLWAQMADAFGAKKEQRNPYIQAISSARMMGRPDVWSNMIRLSAAAFGAVCGGADMVTLRPYTHDLGPATNFARRISNNLQLMMMEESHLGQVEDPAYGSYAHEVVTQNLARNAWTLFQKLEAGGGWPECKTGFLKDIAQARARRAQKISDGEIALVGINRFVKPDVRRAEVRKAPKPVKKIGDYIDSPVFAEAVEQARTGHLTPGQHPEPVFPETCFNMKGAP